MVEQPSHNRQVRGSDPHPSHQLIPSAIRASVRDYVRAHQIFKPGPVVVAVSGGADSTALLLLLAELADELGLVLHVAHFDHGTRPRQSAEDAEFAARLANRVGAPIRVGRAARPTKSEDDARRARYAFLRRAAGEIGATAIATGHTRDDQAETVLLHLARGSGVAGLGGMRPLRDGIARPLLGIGRAETAAVCRAARVRPRSDPTNRALAYARNRVRHRVLPELAKINPRVREAIARLADTAAALGAQEERQLAETLARATRGETIALAELGEGELRAGALALAWTRATGRVLGARQRQALERLASAGEGSRAIDLPGGRAVREYQTLRIAVGEEPTSDAARSLEPGREIAWNGWRVALDADGADAGAHVARVPDALVSTIAVRPRRPGDRLNGPGGRKLQDVFTDAKIPVSERARWPVITSAKAVWWVPALTPPPAGRRGIRLAVAVPARFGNVRWSAGVRQVASKKEAVTTPPQRGSPN